MRLYLFCFLNWWSSLFICTRQVKISPWLLEKVIFVKLSIRLTLTSRLRRRWCLWFLLNWLFSSGWCCLLRLWRSSPLSFNKLLCVYETQNIWLLDEIFSSSSFDLGWKNLESLEIESSWWCNFEFLSFIVVFVVKIMNRNCSINFLFLCLCFTFGCSLLFRCSWCSLRGGVLRHIETLYFFFLLD